DRAAAGRTITVGPAGLARLTFDAGPDLLLDRDATVAIADEATLEISAGRVFVDAAEGEELFVRLGERQLRIADAAASVRVEDGALVAYVVRGELSWRRGEEARGIASSGEELRLTEGDAATEAVT